MNKRNTWLGIGLVVIVIIVIFGVVHKSTKSTPPTSSSTTSSSKAATSNVPSVVVTKTDPTAGEFLATPGGQPLYTYGGDTTGVSNCSGSCIADWPVYGPVSSTATLPANITVITRSDGKVQYAYKGMPLYTFISDTNGTPTGDGVSNFHLAKP